MRKGVLLLFCIFYVFGFSFTIDAQMISTIAGNGIGGFSGDGAAATAAEVNYPWGVAVDNAHNIYIADYNNFRIREVNASGIINTIAGSATATYYGDGGAAVDASLNFPQDVVITPAGKIYIADAGNNVIRMINTAGIITTVAGNDTNGFSGDGGPAISAELDQPSGIAVDRNGNLYIADYNNYRVRKVDTFGIITTFAGNGYGAGVGSGGYSGDGGPATAAELFYPSGVAVDAAGNVYIADYQNNAVRKVNAAGIITTVVGTGVSGYSGDGGLATAAHISNPTRVAVDTVGNLYISDAGNNRIRKVNTLGIINTISGTGSAGYGGDGGYATAATLNRPAGISVDGSGKVYIADENNSRIRVISSSGFFPSFTRGASQSLTVCENSLFNSISSLLTIHDSDIGQTETWTVSALPAHGTVNGIPAAITSNGDTITPAGIGYIPATGYSGTDVFTIKISDGRTVAATTIHVTINPLPAPGPISGSSTLCVSDSIHLSDVLAGGAWSSGSPGLALTGDGEAIGLSTGIDTVEYTVTNSCGATTVKKAITINPVPDAGVIIGPVSICVGDTAVYASASIYAVIDSGGVWSTSNAAATITTGTGILTAVSADTVTLIFTVTNSCGTAVATQPVTVNAVPHADTILGLSTLCEGYAVVLLDTGTAGGTWTCSNGSATVADGLVLGISGGIDTVLYTVTNTCGTAISRKIVTIDSTPVVGAITGPSTVCAGASINLSDAAAGGTWSTDNAFAGVTGDGEVIGVSGGVDTVKYSISNSCASASISKVITVVALPALSMITGPDTVCQTQTITLSDSVSGGAWISEFSSIATVSSSGVVTGNEPGLDSITYSKSNGCGTTKKKVYVYVQSTEACGLVSGVNTLNTPLVADLKVYPNPNDGSFTLQLVSEKNEDVQVVITNMAGEKVLGLTTVTNRLTDINLIQPAGIYFLTATTATAGYTAKITVN